MSEGKLFIGTSGFQYDHWQSVFYPSDLPKKDWFSYYAARFNSVEINSTFYNLPKKETMKKWRQEFPDNFYYVLKFSRYGSHIKRLKDPESTIGKFWDVASHLGDSLAAVLVQLPPKWKPVPERLNEFLRQLPKDTRWALEFRDERWLSEEVFDILRKYNVALCVHDMLADHPQVLTSDWIYLRFHGENYAGSYTEEELQIVAENIQGYFALNKDVMCFFNNDAKGWAVDNAANLQKKTNNALFGC